MQGRTSPWTLSNIRSLRSPLGFFGVTTSRPEQEPGPVPPWVSRPLTCSTLNEPPRQRPRGQVPVFDVSRPRRCEDNWTGGTGGVPRTARGQEAVPTATASGFAIARDGSPQRSLLQPRSCVQELALPLRGLRSVSELCGFCFKVLISHLHGRTPPPFPDSADPLFRAPLFVTWLKSGRGERADAREQELRGCIGCLEPVLFCSGLSEYALRSALQDKRFPPVRLDELPSLACRLSILYQFETCAHLYDWQVGLHGVLINFADVHGRQYSATYLPEVPREHGMTRDIALRELVAKAGYDGQCDQDLLSRIQVTRYRTHVESVPYVESLALAGDLSAT